MTTTGGAENSFNKRQKLIVAVICITKFVNQLASFWGTVCIPLESREKDISMFVVGLLTAMETAVSWLTAVILSGTFLKLGGKNATGRLFFAGILIHSASTLFVAVAALIQNKYVFISYFLVTYSLSGIGMACVYTAINTLIIAELKFDNLIAKAKSFETICYTLGTVFSFISAGILYQFGKIALVVITLGGIEFIWLLLCFRVIPVSKLDMNSKEDYLAITVDRSLTWSVGMKLTKEVSITFTLLNHFMRFLILSFNQPILSLHLINAFGLQPIFVGIVVALAYIAAAISAYPWIILGSSRIRRIVILLSTLWMICLIAPVMGPTEYFQEITGLRPSLPLICTMLAIAGISLSPGMVLDVADIADTMRRKKLDLNVSNSGTSAALLTSFEFLGLFLGPPLGGYLNDKYGFGNAFFFGSIIPGFFSLLWLLYFIKSYFKHHKKVPADVEAVQDKY